jgi:hypothetical protein
MRFAQRYAILRPLSAFSDVSAISGVNPLELPSAKWGFIGFGAALVSCALLFGILFVIDVYVFDFIPRYAIPGFVIFPMSAIAMLLVYRRWLQGSDRDDPTTSKLGGWLITVGISVVFLKSLLAVMGIANLLPGNHGMTTLVYWYMDNLGIDAASPVPFRENRQGKGTDYP